MRPLATMALTGPGAPLLPRRGPPAQAFSFLTPMPGQSRSVTLPSTT